MKFRLLFVVLSAWVLTHCVKPVIKTPSVRVKQDSVTVFDAARNRRIPVALYAPGTATNSWKGYRLALLSHGYGGTNTEYSYLAHALVARGYVVASVQHELPGDEPIANTGNLSVTRRPNWERGVQNLRYVQQYLARTRPELDTRQVLVMGHSNGGDMTMLFATEYPALVEVAISLDNRRMPLPRTRKPRLLTIRSSDQPADEGVLPTPQEQQKFGITVVQLPNTIHNDMGDGGTEAQKREITGIIDAFLAR